MLGYLRQNLKDTRLSSRPGESSSAKPKTTQTATIRQETTRRTATTQESHYKLEFDFAVPGQSKRRSDESPRRHSDYSRESDSPSRKRSRHSGNSSGETTRIFVVQKDSESWRPQGDDGSTERPPEVRPVPQRQDDRLVLRQCHNSCLSQAIGRHKVSGPVPQGQGNTPVDRIYENHDSPPVHPGSSQHESGPPQSSEPGNRIRVDATPVGGPGSSPPVAGDHRPVCNLADGKAPSVL